MISIRTVLCPVDFSMATGRQINLATDLCQAFEAQLVLHHNLAMLAAGAGVGWMWAADHPDQSASEAAAEKRLRARFGRSRSLRPEASRKGTTERYWLGFRYTPSP